MNNLELPKIPFSLERASELYKNGLLKDNLDVKNYMNIFFNVITELYYFGILLQ